jgi:hypothetical protein
MAKRKVTETAASGEERGFEMVDEPEVLWKAEDVKIDTLSNGKGRLRCMHYPSIGKPGFRKEREFKDLAAAQAAAPLFRFAVHLDGARSWGHNRAYYEEQFKTFVPPTKCLSECVQSATDRQQLKKLKADTGIDLSRSRYGDLIKSKRYSDDQINRFIRAMNRL